MMALRGPDWLQHIELITNFALHKSKEMTILNLNLISKTYELKVECVSPTSIDILTAGVVVFVGRGVTTITCLSQSDSMGPD